MVILDLSWVVEHALDHQLTFYVPVPISTKLFLIDNPQFLYHNIAKASKATERVVLEASFLIYEVLACDNSLFMSRWLIISWYHAR